MFSSIRHANDIPIKFASRETAVTSEFNEKWAGRNAAIVITDLWHGSGVPQKRLAQVLHLIGAAPMQSEVLVVLQASDAAISCAKGLLKASPESHIVYDSTATFEAMYPPDSFQWEGDMASNPMAGNSRLIYTGPSELVPPVVTDAYIDALIATAEDRLCRVETADRHLFRSREKLDPFTAKRYIDAMSCGMVHIPSRAEMGIMRTAGVDDDELFRDIRDHVSGLGYLGQLFFALPVPEKVSDYMESVTSACEHTKAMREIWERALSCTPFTLGDDRDKLDEFVHNMDARTVEAIAEATGAKQMIDAYMSGVPLEDILA